MFWVQISAWHSGPLFALVRSHKIIKKQTNENTKIFIERTHRELGKGYINKPCPL
jgi:hypothetical protein